MTSADNAKGGDAEAVVMSYDETEVVGVGWWTRLAWEIPEAFQAGITILLSRRSGKKC